MHFIADNAAQELPALAAPATAFLAQARCVRARSLSLSLSLPLSLVFSILKLLLIVFVFSTFIRTQLWVDENWQVVLPAA